jgi:hypothetical protein
VEITVQQRYHQPYLKNYSLTHKKIIHTLITPSIILFFDSTQVKRGTLILRLKIGRRLSLDLKKCRTYRYTDDFTYQFTFQNKNDEDQNTNHGYNYLFPFQIKTMQFGL